MVTTAEMQKKIVETIEKVAPGSEIYLFGSRARGAARPDSDWDVLVLVDGEKRSRVLENQIIDALFELLLETGELATPIIITKKDWQEKYVVTPLYENIIRDGISLHQWK